MTVYQSDQLSQDRFKDGPAVRGELLLSDKEGEGGEGESRRERKRGNHKEREDGCIDTGEMETIVATES